MIISRELLSLPLVLSNSDLIRDKCFVDVKTDNTISSILFVIRFKPKTKYDIFRIRKLAKQEDYYYNSKSDGRYFCETFTVPKKYQSYLKYFINDHSKIDDSIIHRFNRFNEKSLAARDEQPGFIFFIIILIVQMMQKMFLCHRMHRV